MSNNHNTIKELLALFRKGIIAATPKASKIPVRRIIIEIKITDFFCENGIIFQRFLYVLNI